MLGLIVNLQLGGFWQFLFLDWQFKLSILIPASETAYRRENQDMKKNLVRIAAGVASLLVVAYFAIGYVVYDKLSKVEPGGGDNAGNTPAAFQNTIEEWPDFDVSPYFMGEFEEVHFPSRQEGLELAGWYVPGDPGAPVVILTHGFGSCKCSTRILTAAGMLNRNGFNVFMYDMREHGESDIEDGRAAVGTEEYLDLLGAWDWLIREK